MLDGVRNDLKRLLTSRWRFVRICDVKQLVIFIKREPEWFSLIRLVQEAIGDNRSGYWNWLVQAVPVSSI